MKLRIFLWAVLYFATSVSAATPPRTATLKGTVHDEQGAVIATATISIHWNMPRASGPKVSNGVDPVIMTNRFGEFSIALTPGFYDVCVHAKGFSPTCQTIATASGRTSVYRALLKPNPLITKEFGDVLGHEMIANPAPVLPQELPSSIPNLDPH